MIPESQLAHWEQLCREATAGPWRDVTDLSHKYYGSRVKSADGGTLEVWRFGNGTEPSRNEAPDLEICDSHYQTANDLADVEFIAEARTALPALLAEVKRLQERVAELEGVSCGYCRALKFRDRKATP